MIKKMQTLNRNIQRWSLWVIKKALCPFGRQRKVDPFLSYNAVKADVQVSFMSCLVLFFAGLYAIDLVD